MFSNISEIWIVEIFFCPIIIGTLFPIWLFSFVYDAFTFGFQEKCGHQNIHQSGSVTPELQSLIYSDTSR